MAKGIKRPTVKGPLYSYLGRFQRAKHIQAGHNTSIQDILNRPPERSSRASAAAVTPTATRMTPQMTGGMASTARRSTPTPTPTASTKPPKDTRPTTMGGKKLNPKSVDVQNMDPKTLKFVQDAVEKRTARLDRLKRLDSRTNVGGGRN